MFILSKNIKYINIPKYKYVNLKTAKFENFYSKWYSHIT